MGGFEGPVWAGTMHSILADAERLIRGDSTRPDFLTADGLLDISVRASARVVLTFGLAAGVFTGIYALSTGGFEGVPQLIASTVKIPLMFLITIAVCFPSLFVFSALLGSRLRAEAVLRLVFSNLAVMAIVTASFGPIVAFFALGAPSYGFMVLLNAATAGVAGLLGLGFLLRTLDRVIRVQAEADAAETIREPVGDSEVIEGALSPAEGEAGPELGDAAPGPLDGDGPVHDRTKLVFKAWVVLFGMVGAQSSWMLRPLIGSPGAPFELFREQEGNFLVGIFQALSNMFGG